MKIFLGLLVCLLTLSPVAAQQAQTPESKFVTGVADALFAAVNKGGSRKEIEAALQLIFADHLDADSASRIALGDSNREINPKQRQDFVAAYKDTVTNSYAYSFSQYKKATYKIIPASKPSDPVRLEMMLNGQSPLNIDFYLNKTKEGGYLIHDLAIDGSSTNYTFKRTFVAIINRAGIDGLIITMQKQTALTRAK